MILNSNVSRAEKNLEKWILKYNLNYEKTVSWGRGKMEAISDDLKALLILKWSNIKIYFKK